MAVMNQLRGGGVERLTLAVDYAAYAQVFIPSSSTYNPNARMTLDPDGVTRWR